MRPSRPTERLAGVLAAVLAALAFLAYSHAVPPLPDPGLWPATIVIALVGLPLAAACAICLARYRDAPFGLLVAGGLVAAGAAALLSAADLTAEASLAKILAVTALGFAGARIIGSLLEAALLAVVILVVDIYSVAAGPTHVIVEEHPDVLDAFTIAAPAPGGQTAQLGVSDVLFLAIFTALALRFAPRPRLAIALMVGSFGASYAIAVALDRATPALPLLSIAFLIGVAGPLRDRLRRPRA
jgi:hypothetical protein